MSEKQKRKSKPISSARNNFRNLLILMVFFSITLMIVIASFTFTKIAQNRVFDSTATFIQGINDARITAISGSATQAVLDVTAAAEAIATESP